MGGPTREGAEEFTLAADLVLPSNRHIVARDAGDREQAGALGRSATLVYVPPTRTRKKASERLAGRARRHDMSGEWEEAAAAYHTIVEASDPARPPTCSPGACARASCGLRLDEQRAGSRGAPDAAAARRGALPHGRDRRRRQRRPGTPGRGGRRAGGVARPPGRLGRRAAHARPRRRPARALPRGAARGPGRPRAAGARAPARRRRPRRSGGRRRPRARSAAGALPAGAPAARHQRLASPSIADVGAALEAGEAVAAIGLHFTGTISVLVAPDEHAAPRAGCCSTTSPRSSGSNSSPAKARATATG